MRAVIMLCGELRELAVKWEWHATAGVTTEQPFRVRGVISSNHKRFMQMPQP